MMRASNPNFAKPTSTVDFKDLEQANKAAKTIEDLENLLHQRTEELEQSMNDLAVFAETV